LSSFLFSLQTPAHGHNPTSLLSLLCSFLNRIPLNLPLPKNNINKKKRKEKRKTLPPPLSLSHNIRQNTE
jgi:hypothetical protein